MGIKQVIGVAVGAVALAVAYNYLQQKAKAETTPTVAPTVTPTPKPTEVTPTIAPIEVVPAVTPIEVTPTVTPAEVTPTAPVEEEKKEVEREAAEARAAQEEATRIAAEREAAERAALEEAARIAAEQAAAAERAAQEEAARIAAEQEKEKAIKEQISYLSADSIYQAILYNYPREVKQKILDDVKVGIDYYRTKQPTDPLPSPIGNFKTWVDLYDYAIAEYNKRLDLPYIFSDTIGKKFGYLSNEVAGFRLKNLIDRILGSKRSRVGDFYPLTQDEYNEITKTWKDFWPGIDAKTLVCTPSELVDYLKKAGVYPQTVDVETMVPNYYGFINDKKLVANYSDFYNHHAAGISRDIKDYHNNMARNFSTTYMPDGYGGYISIIDYIRKAGFSNIPLPW